MLGSPIPPNLNPALPDATGTAHHPLEAPSSDWTSTMTTSGPATVLNATTSNKRRRDSMQQDIAGRDCYNNLKQSELIDLLVVKLQEQNLILTRLLERSTLTATATTTATSSNNNRLNPNPVVNFTRTKSGSAASRYASEKDFPALNLGTKKGSATATKATTTTAASKKKKSGNQKSSKAKHLEPPADATEAKNGLYQAYGIKRQPIPLATTTQFSSILDRFINKQVGRDEAKINFKSLALRTMEKKIAKAIGNLVSKLPLVAIEENVNEIELCSRFIDPFLAGLFDDPNNSIYFRWLDETTLEAKAKKASSSRPDLSVTKSLGVKWATTLAYGEAKVFNIRKTRKYLFE